MDTLVKEKISRKEQYFMAPVQSEARKSFENAVAECKGVSVDVFIDELRKRVKERYQNAKG